MMKKRMLATVMAAIMLLSLMPAVAMAASSTSCDGGTSCSHVAAIGNTHYDTLKEAVAAVTGNTETTITLLKDVGNGDGIIISSDKNIVIDFANHTYTVTQNLAGSQGTQNQCFQLLKDSNITLKNGTVVANNSGIKMMIQNYSNLTLDSMTLDATRGTNSVNYVSSNNCGAVLVKGSTSITAKTSGKAFDVSYWPSAYPAGTQVVIDTAGTITGDIEIGLYGSNGSITLPSKSILSVENVNLVGSITMLNTKSGQYSTGLTDDEAKAAFDGKMTVTGGTFSTDVSAYTGEGVVCTDNGDGTYTVENLSAQNAVAEVNGSYYKTLSAAITAATDGQTVKLLKDSTNNTKVEIRDGKKITLDMNGFDAGFAQNNSIKIYHGGLNITGSGKLYEQFPYYAPVMLHGSNTSNDSNYTTVTVGKDVTLEGWAGLFIDQLTSNNNGANAFGIVVTVNGTLHSVKDTSGAGGHALYINGTIKATEGNVPQIILDGATLKTESGNGMYLAGYAETTITDTSITADTGIEIRAGKLTIEDGTTITATAVPTTVTPNGNGSTTDGAGVAVAQHTTKLPIDVTINGGTIKGYSALYQSNPQNNGEGDIAKVVMTVTGGNFQAISGGTLAVYSENKTGFISGGYFTSDPSAYLAEDLVAVESDVSGYNYTVAEKEETAAVVAPPAVDVAEPDLPSSASEADKNLADNLKTALESAPPTFTGAGIDAAIKTEANDNAQTATEQVVADLNEALGNSTATTENTKIVVQPYMDIQITGASDPSETEEPKTLTLEITPMYRTLATIEEVTDETKFVLTDEEGTVNAVQIGTSQPLTITKPITITVTLPSGFITNTTETPVHAYVKHVKDNGATYVYTGTVDSSNVLTFVNPNGFSSFTISAKNESVAEVNGVGYTTLQAAVDAVPNGGTITLLQDAGSAVVSRAVSFTVERVSGQSYTATITAGTNYTMTKDETTGLYTFTYNPPYVPPTDPEEPEELPFTDVDTDDWFYEAVKYAYDNGMMNGMGDGLFAPSSNLTRGMIAQVFYNLEGKPVVSGESPFGDVEVGQWYADAVNWAAANDIVEGYGNGKFGPKDDITREQMAQILYNYAVFKGYDVSAQGDLSVFNDGANTSDWALPAMQWAVGTGLVQGYDGNLNPTGTATRAEVAQILMNFHENIVK